jgi:hypothetical protein
VLLDGENSSKAAARQLLTGRRLIACAECGWVHYAMTAEEKSAADAEKFALASRYRLSDAELDLIELSQRRCLRCESPAAGFRLAAPEDLEQAEGHIVTPIYVESM